MRALGETPGAVSGDESPEALAKAVSELESANAKLRSDLAAPLPSRRALARRLCILMAVLALIGFGAGYYLGATSFCHGLVV